MEQLKFNVDRKAVESAIEMWQGIEQDPKHPLHRNVKPGAKTIKIKLANATFNVPEYFKYLTLDKRGTLAISSTKPKEANGFWAMVEEGAFIELAKCLCSREWLLEIAPKMIVEIKNGTDIVKELEKL